jgi:hypothetical protein
LEAAALLLPKLIGAAAFRAPPIVMWSLSDEASYLTV